MPSAQPASSTTGSAEICEARRSIRSSAAARLASGPMVTGVGGHDVHGAQVANVIVARQGAAQIAIGDKPSQAALRRDHAGSAERQARHGDDHLF